jgi:hypothetical protein
MVLEDSIEVRRGSTYEQVGEDRGSKEMDGCPLTIMVKNCTGCQLISGHIC